jgi:adenosylcobinamide kinase/adenosylcobinamide-phosphate guanylyltransferase
MITLVLGGSRSGKSELGEQLAARHGAPLTYVATLELGGDADLEARVALHRVRRGPDWITVESGVDLPGVLEDLTGTVLVDSLGPWVSGIEAVDTGAAAKALCGALRSRDGDTVVVSDEVGMAVHATTEQGRRFTDALGAVNREVSAVADRAFFVVAGRALPLPPLGCPS